MKRKITFSPYQGSFISIEALLFEDLENSYLVDLEITVTDTWSATHGTVAIPTDEDVVEFQVTDATLKEFSLFVANYHKFDHVERKAIFDSLHDKVHSSISSYDEDALLQWLDKGFMSQFEFWPDVIERSDEN